MNWYSVTVYAGPISLIFNILWNRFPEIPPNPLATKAEVDLYSTVQQEPTYEVIDLPDISTASKSDCEVATPVATVQTVIDCSNNEAYTTVHHWTTEPHRA